MPSYICPNCGKIYYSAAGNKEWKCEKCGETLREVAADETS
jgi:tRNA(Ile2) C34 agmatinyltransferase TiaS